MHYGNNDYRSLFRGNETFTIERLESILENERFSYDYRREPHARAYSSVTYGAPEIRCEIDTTFFEFEHESEGIRFHSNRQTRQRAVEFCKQLYGGDSPECISIRHLDAEFSRIFKFRFEPLGASQAIVEQASALLERMPASPPNLDDIPSNSPSEYRTTREIRDSLEQITAWEKLPVTTYVSSTILRAALAAVMWPGCVLALLDTTDITATLLEIASGLADNSWKSFNVRAFLWTTWQRLQMIYYHIVAANYLDEGSTDGKKGKLALRGTFPSPGLTLHDMSKQRVSLSKSPYMCSWNFELLRTNPVCIGADFRKFHQCYNASFGNQPARCVEGQSNSCNGDSPRSCKRFQGMAIEDQSAHDQSCLGKCNRLTWDETSYRSVIGGRAVSFELTAGHSSGSLQYCSASQSTLAISHVWSHGQGGRPETGLNSCLHTRYSRIAKSYGCDSYWIDTACIPEDHRLRAESISKINEIFIKANIMLVCDRDIMALDFCHSRTEDCETALVTAIVSDWNVRAWTFFEAFRARRTLHLLCKNNVVVPLKQIIDVVHRNGALEIGNLVLAMPHFLPPLDDRELARRSFRGRGEFEEGHLAVEMSGSLLSHRAASRPNDEFVIWSLLMSEKTICYDAEAFWKSMQGLAFQSDPETGQIYSDAASIKTGFLVSSAPRLRAKGLSWAPSSPALHASTMSDEGYYNGYDGGESYSGWITPDGLVADWLLLKFDGNTLKTRIRSLLPNVWTQSSELRYQHNITKIRARYLKGYRWGAILCPIQEPGGANQGYWYEDGGRSRRTIVAVCGTNEVTGIVAQKYTFNNTVPTRVKWDYHNEVMGWKWRGAYVWDNAEPLPPMRRAEKFLIA